MNPIEPLYAALSSRSIHHEGDERSRTNPGHGYPAYTEDFVEFIPFKTRAEMESYVKSEQAHGRTPHVIEYSKLTVTTTVHIAVSR